jgi:thymidylate synthase
VATVTTYDVRNDWQFPTLQDAYRHVCQYVVKYGRESEPRGKLTREVLCPTLVIEKPHACLPTGVGRGVSPRVAAVEAVQLVGAFHDPELMVSAAGHFEKFREPRTGMMWGAYGFRIQNQVTAAWQKLAEDRDSRQAVVTLWEPVLDNVVGKKDYPCTIALQFLIRDDELICVTDMRSNDVWLGLAYDLFQFGQLQWTVANILGCGVGPIIHRPVSLHAYEDQWGLIEDLHAPRYPAEEYFGFRSLLRARDIGMGNPPTADRTPTEDWFVEQVTHLFELKDERLLRGRPPAE